MTFRGSSAIVFPALVAGSNLFTFSLTLGDYITPDLVSDAKFIGNVIYDTVEPRQPAAGGGVLLVPIVIMTTTCSSRADWAPSSRCDGPVMTETRTIRILLRWRRRSSSRSSTCRWSVLAYHAFNSTQIRWQASGRVTLQWFGDAVATSSSTNHPNSIIVATVATAMALVLGPSPPSRSSELLVLRPTVTLVLPVLPIASWRVVTDIALRTTFVTFGIDFGS